MLSSILQSTMVMTGSGQSYHRNLESAQTTFALERSTPSPQYNFGSFLTSTL